MFLMYLIMISYVCFMHFLCGSYVVPFTDSGFVRCEEGMCLGPIYSVLNMIYCLQCHSFFHKRCVGHESGVGTFSIPFCKECNNPKGHENNDMLFFKNQGKLATAAVDTSKNALAKSTQKTMASRIHKME